MGVQPLPRRRRAAEKPAGAGSTQQVTVAPGGGLDFDSQTIGTESDPKQLTITNHTSAGNTGLTVWYEDLPNFRITDNTCSNVPVPDQGSCSFKVAFAPKNMYQRQGNIWIIPTSAWNDYQGLWAKYKDASRAEEDLRASLKSANKTVTAGQRKTQS